MRLSFSLRPSFKLLCSFVACLLVALLVAATSAQQVAYSAQAFASPDFQRVWNRTDKQVASGAASRTWLWGPEPFSAGLVEDYAEAPGGKRQVQYFDKSRMEINNPAGDKNSPYYVTNGLIAIELISGRQQVGDNKFVDRAPAQIGVAGDPNDTTGPTYAALDRVRKPAASDETGILVAGSIDRTGNTRFDVGDYGNKWKVSYAYYEPTTKQNIAGPFWTFLTQQTMVLNDAGQAVQGKLFDPVFYATGLPITGAYWAQVKVGGTTKDVLVQAFERRVLTFTPTNAPAFQVEMGNIGRHYYEWRYNSMPGGGGSNPPPQPTQPPVTTTQPPVLAPTPTPTPTPRPTTAAPPAGGATCTGVTPAYSASLSINANLARSDAAGGNQTICIAANKGGQPVAGASASITVRYKTTTRNFNAGTTGSDGKLSYSWNVGSPSKNYEVDVDVTVNYGGETATTRVSWTPR
jgi:hypothetical protein